MKYTLILPLALLGAASMLAQTLERKVIGTSGGMIQSPAGALHFTVGETGIAPRQAGGTYWGEGFQQTWTAPTISTSNLQHSEAITLTVYPNPASSILTVASGNPLQIQLFDLSGRATGQLTPLHGSVELDLSDLPAGFYLLQAFDENGRLAGAAKVQHIR